MVVGLVGFRLWWGWVGVGLGLGMGCGLGMSCGLGMLFFFSGCEWLGEVVVGIGKVLYVCFIIFFGWVCTVVGNFVGSGSIWDHLLLLLLLVLRWGGCVCWVFRVGWRMEFGWDLGSCV